MKLKITLLLSFLLFGNVALAQDESFKTLISAKSLKCFFTTSAFGDWKDGKAKAQISNENMEITFDSIDLKNFKARMIGNQAATDVLVTVAPNGITFIETTGMGNMIFTTIFSEWADKYSKEFKVTHSRHIGTLLGTGAIPSQFYGTCKVWE